MGTRYEDTLVFDTIADMQAAQRHQDGQPALCIGFTTRGDGFVRRYYWDDSSSTTDSASTTAYVVKITNETIGRWIAFDSPLVSITATDAITAGEHAGRQCVINAAAGLTLTLPAAVGSGDVYKIAVGTTVTSNSAVIQVANATDEFVGVVIQVDADTSDTLAAYPALDADGFDTITMNGSTTGGIQGDYYIITDIASGKFLLEGYQSGTGTVATPLSAAVA